MPPITSPKTGRAPAFTVFELVNDRLQEIYVGRTDGPVFRVLFALRDRPAPAIGHWNLDDARPVRSIEFDMKDDEADEFIAHYVRTPLPKGWRFLT